MGYLEQPSRMERLARRGLDATVHATGREVPYSEPAVVEYVSNKETFVRRRTRHALTNTTRGNPAFSYGYAHGGSGGNRRKDGGADPHFPGPVC